MMRDHVPELTIGTRLAKSADGLGVDLVDVRTLVATKVEQSDPKAESFISDGKGVIRLMASRSVVAGGMMGANLHWLYRKAGSRQWESFSVVANDKGLRPLSVDPATNSVYCLDTKDGHDALFRVSLDGSMKTELLVSDPHADVDDVLRLGRQARLIGAVMAGDKGQVVYFDPTYRQLAESLSKALPGLPIVRFLSSSGDENKILLSAGSDVDPGRFYVFDKTSKHLNEVALARPQLEHVPLAPMTQTHFRASDGTMIPAFLTLPPGGASKGLPTIVMPHGGPASHDEWGFDWLAQFFAHQGYAVLQPEFRGSTGYGDAWMLQNGFKSWRTSVGDVVDAGRWLVSQGIAAPDKLAIVGWSYGGYAALQSNVVDAGLFKAVVAIAPVTDLDVLRSEKNGFTNAALTSDFIGHGPHVAEGSPARHADLFKAPVLLFHGTADQNVGVEESRLMNDHLRAAGKTSTVVVYPDLDHQLPSGEIRADMLRRADGFLRASMKMPAAAG
jgi:dipeptidyl aminopeptidase/acylaminoacyl peptidase